jgi:hypothetical protein
MYLDDNVDAHLSPWELEWVPAGDDLDGLAVDADGGVVDDLDVGLEGAQHRVVLEEVRRLKSIQSRQDSWQREGVSAAWTIGFVVGVTYVPDASAVVDDDDVERGVLAAVPAPEEVAADAAEPVDGHLELRLSGRPHRVLPGGLSSHTHTQVNQQSR